MYFSAFRDHLGSDYDNYLMKIESYGTSWSDFSFAVNSEPLFRFISLSINTSSCFTPLLVFLIFSIVILLGVFRFYTDKNNNFLAATLVVFSLFPTLFFNTFNLIRQFTAASLFLWGTTYIQNKKYLPCLLLIIIAITIHFSALILIPIIFFIDKKIPIKYLIIIGVLSFVILSYFSDFLDMFSLLSERYDVYTDVDQKMQSSGMILLIDLVLMLFLFNYNKITTPFDRIVFNCLFLCALFNNLSYSSYFFFRVAVYFNPVFAYALPKGLSYICGKKLAVLLSSAVALFLFLGMIISNEANPMIVPNTMLSPFDLFK